MHFVPEFRLAAVRPPAGGGRAAFQRREKDANKRLPCAAGPRAAEGGARLENCVEPYVDELEQEQLTPLLPAQK